MGNRRLNRILNFLALSFILGLVIFFSFNFIKALKDSFPLSFVSPFSTQANSSLEKVVKNSLDGAKGTYSIVIKNLKTNEVYFQNEHKVFETGSLYKIWIMAEAFNQIKNGKLKEDDELSEDVEILNNTFNIPLDSAELTEGTITLTVNEAIKQMITISHNYAALLLTEKLKLSNVAKFLKDNGLNESEVGTGGDSPKSSPYDIALFFEKLYKRELTDSQYSEKMFNLLKEQKRDNKLPKNLQDDVVIAHKTGEIGFLTHDGGIVYTPKGDYIIVLMSESDSPPGAEERIAKISEGVYKYFTSGRR